MVKHLKILLLFIFVTVPALDIAFLDNQEPSDHYSEAYHDAGGQHDEAAADLHCICHVIHHGVSMGRVASLDASNKHFKARPIAAILGHGLHPKPGLHPPTFSLS